MLGWFILGAAVLAVAIVAFWDEIKGWLNSTAADVVGDFLGYDARKNMQKAICKADRIVNKIRNVATVYVRKPGASHIDKVTMETSAPQYEISEEVRDKIEREGWIEQEFEYRG
ncbi:MAG: hypothetical protein K6E91_06235 [Butyrivibrio sp.]|nr:hypothetical protein [Butyrivibrio sp.]